MKLFLKAVFFFGFIQVNAQVDYQRVSIPTLNSGVYGDTLSRVIKAGEEGACIRFIHSEFGTTAWNQDSLVKRLISIYGLNKSSTHLDLALAVGDFVKQSGMFKHVTAYGSSFHNYADMGECKSSGFEELNNLVGLPSGICSDFSLNYSRLLNFISSKFGKEIRTRIVYLEGHVVVEFFNRDAHKWIYIDTDPKTTLLIVKNGEILCSSRELWNRSSLFLENIDFVRNYESSFDSLLDYNNLSELSYIFKNSSRIVYHKGKEETVYFDYYYQLSPGQELIWTYTVDGLYLDKSRCSFELETLVSNGISGYNRKFDHSLFHYAICQNLPFVKIFDSWRKGSFMFAEANCFGKSEKRLNVFSSKIYTPHDSFNVYIPHLIKEVRRGYLTINNFTLNEKFSLSLFSIDNKSSMDSFSCKDLYLLEGKVHTKEELLEIVFYSNDDLNFEVDSNFEIAVFNGNIEVQHFQNGKVIWSSSM